MFCDAPSRIYIKDKGDENSKLDEYYFSVYEKIIEEIKVKCFAIKLFTKDAQE